VLSSWPLKVIVRVHLVHLLNECRAAHKRLSTLRPSHLTWAVSPPVGSYRLQPPSPFIIITQPERWYSFTVPHRAEGWLDLGTAGRVHTARAQGCKLQWLCDKHNCPQRDSISGPRALQLDILPLDHCPLLEASITVLYQCIVIVPFCISLCVCYHITWKKSWSDLYQTRFVVSGGDCLKLIKFWDL